MENSANQKLLKQLNEIRLLNIIKQKGPISRSELAKQTRISKVAISDIVNRLNDDGFILEIGKGNSTNRGGKRPTLLKLNPENGYVIGIEIQRRHAVVVLANIQSEIKEMRRIFYQPGTPYMEIISRLFEEIDRLLTDPYASKLISIGIGIPGFVDYQKGSLIFADSMVGWEGLPFSSIFSERYNVPTLVENDVNNITLGESLKGAGRGYPNLVCIYIGEGLGAGLIVDGQLVRGATGSAGEIGYLEISNFCLRREKIKSLYHNHTYFGEILSEKNLLATLHETLAIKEIYDNEEDEKKALIRLVKRSDRGDRDVSAILREYAYLLSIICSVFIKTINPNLILLSGKVLENSDYLIDQVRKQNHQSLKDISLQGVTLQVGSLGENAGIQGAIDLALLTLFESPVTRRNNHYKRHNPY